MKVKSVNLSFSGWNARWNISYITKNMLNGTNFQEIGHTHMIGRVSFDEVEVTTEKMDELCDKSWEDLRVIRYQIALHFIYKSLFVSLLLHPSLLHFAFFSSPMTHFYFINIASFFGPNILSTLKYILCFSANIRVQQMRFWWSSMHFWSQYLNE